MFERVRLRRTFKALAAAGVTRSSLAMTAARLGRSRDALESITEDFLDRHFQVTALAQGKIRRAAFEALPDEIKLRALGRVLSLIGGTEQPPRLMKLERLLSHLKLKKGETTLCGCIIVAGPETLDFYREAGRLRIKPMAPEPGAKRVWDGRFLLAFASFADSTMTVRQLGADGWLCHAKMRKERGASLEANRLAALTTPALWKGNGLICAPVLEFLDPAGSPERQPMRAALAPGLARFLTGARAEAACVLGKDTPIPYL